MDTTARELPALPDLPTAIFCASYRWPSAATRPSRKPVYRSRDISVVGFDDASSSRHLEPPLATVRVPHEDMGRRAITHIYAKREAQKDLIITGRLQIDCPLMVRKSVGSPREHRLLKLA